MATNWLLCVFVAVMVFQVRGRGHIEIRFMTYDNPGGLEESGACCDGKWSFCPENSCDHMFIVCLDAATSSDSTNLADNACRYGRFQTGASPDRDRVTFGSMIGEKPPTRNPLLFNFTSAMPAQGMNLKVDVWDKDKAGSNDHVEFTKKLVKPTVAAVRDQTAVPYRLGSRTRLDLQIKVVCDTNYYGTFCDTVCRPPEPGQHYACDQSTGNKVCQSGWVGERCTAQAQRCHPNYCYNGGSCVEVDGAATCHCPDLLTGFHCEQHTCDQRCAPGTCDWWRPGPDGYECHCPRGYEGRDLPSGMACMESKK